MARLIKRYGSRKLYDTTESRYILLEEIATWIRSGEEIQVVDNKTGENVTTQTLTQVISEEGRKKSGFLSPEILHDLIRAGESAVTNRVRQFQEGMDRLVKKGFDKLVPMTTVREEMVQLRERLEELEYAVSRAESAGDTAKQPQAEVAREEKTETPKKPASRTAAKKTSSSSQTRTPRAAVGTNNAKKSAQRKPAAKKTAVKKATAKSATRKVDPPGAQT